MACHIYQLDSTEISVPVGGSGGIALPQEKSYPEAEDNVVVEDSSK